MPIELTEKQGGKMLEAVVSGTLTDGDYQQFVPEFERLVHHHGKIRVLFEFSRFHGWAPKAAWDDLKFGLKHYDDIERLAFVGQSQWQHLLAAFCKPFTTAEVHYYSTPQMDIARTWLEEGLERGAELPANRN